jgi:hypothetical protein
VAEKPRKGAGPAVLRSAGRTALSVLRHTKQRAKLSTLHLPLDLHPIRQRSILLPPASADSVPAHEGADIAAPAMPAGEAHPRRALAGEETRALRSRLGLAERRVLRLRQTLDRERRARAQAATAIAQPRQLIDHLVADLSQIDAGDGDALRGTVTQVLGAYGFMVSTDESPPEEQRQARLPLDGAALPAIPGWDRVRLRAAVDEILARHPETNARYVTLALTALVRDGAASPATIAKAAGFTSALARHRTRVALDGLCAMGIARREGERCALGPAPDTPPRRRRRPK